MEKIKRPKFIIFTDKDGTLYMDQKLNAIFRYVKFVGGIVIPITGRTVGDIENIFREHNIEIPLIEVGDNGANIRNSKKREFMFQAKLQNKQKTSIADKFIAMGGAEENIRYTDGEHIYAFDNARVREHYKGNSKVKFQSDIINELKQKDKVTKITLSGTEEQMKEIGSYSGTKKIKCWSDIGKTNYIANKEDKYRLDIMPNSISKGAAVKFITRKLRPQAYICVGNDFNDISMFKQAINDGMIAAIMPDAPEEVIDQMQKYYQQKGKGRVDIIEISNNKEKANEYIRKVTKEFKDEFFDYGTQDTNTQTSVGGNDR